MGSDSKSGAGGNAETPPPVKKLLQNIREIVSDKYTDSEIYAVLRDCDMDPNDAVQRLLSDGPRKDSYTFHEVKSKRERRREMKETQEFKVRANNSTLNRGTRVGGEHTFGQSASTHTGSNELGKASLTGESRSVATLQSSASSLYSATGKILNEKSSPQSDSLSCDNRRQSAGTGDTDPVSVQISSAFQPTWVGCSDSRQVSMADIVRMGRPSNKGSQTSFERFYTPQDGNAPDSIHHDNKPFHASLLAQSELSQDLQSLNLEMRHESGKTSSQHDYDNEWLVTEQLAASSGPPISEKSAAIGAEMYPSTSYLYRDRNLLRNNQSDEVQLSERDAVDRKNHNSDYTRSAQEYGGQKTVNGAGGTSKNEDDCLKDISSIDSFGHMYKWHDGRGSDASLPNLLALQSDEVNKTVMTTAGNSQQLSLVKEPTKPPTEDIPGLVLPNYLQAFAADCSHLSFGTYKSGKNSALSGSQASSPLTAEGEKTSAETDSPSAVYSDTRNVNYGDKLLGYTYGTHTATTDTGNRNSSSQAELLNRDFPDTAYGQGYLYSAVPHSTFGNIQERSSTLPSLINTNAKNLVSFPSELQAHSNSVADHFLAVKARGSAAFHVTQSMPSRYGNALSSINPSAISMYEVLNSGAFPRPPSSTQSLDGANLAIRPGHSYSQDGYVMPKRYGLQSDFPHTHRAGDALYGSPPGMKYNLHHRSGVPMRSLPLSSSNLTGGNFENSKNNPLSFVLNPSMASTGSKVGFDEVLPAQFKDGNDFPLYQQNDSAATWEYGCGSVTPGTANPESTYNNFPEHYQHYGGYGQHQLPSQNQGALLHPSIYNSRTGITLEQRHQGLNEFIPRSPQRYSSRELPQIRRPSY